MRLAGAPPGQTRRKVAPAPIRRQGPVLVAPTPPPPPQTLLAAARGAEDAGGPSRRRPRPRRCSQRPHGAGAGAGVMDLEPPSSCLGPSPRSLGSVAPKGQGSSSLRRRVEDSAVRREGAKGDAPAASSQPSPVRPQEPAPSPSAGRGAARESCSARTQRQGAA